MRRRLIPLVVVVVAATVPALAAHASPQSDFDAVYGDWKADGVITQCLWTQAQLQNAYDVANSSPDFQYNTGFQDAVYREINRWKAGGCDAVLGTVRRASPLTGAKIVSVRGGGGAARELVKIRNGSRKALSFRKASLRNRRSGKAVFPAAFKLAKGKTATVHVGCARGARHASYRKTTVWLCRRRQLFRDRGDLARLADPKGVIVSQRGFGSLKRRPVF
jgi:hypothetical protein